MSKRRKFDSKNKRSFIIIIILAILVVAVFSLFIYKYLKASKIEYMVESGSLVQDIDRNYINIDDDAKLKIRWNGNYYLVYNDEKITLGKKVIIYNTITGGMKLYGTFYEISKDGKITKNKNETSLANTTDTKFYKIDDREYLLVASKIYSEDYSIEASNYLLVELDKAGNAKLSNNKINLKTISPTTLVTSEYSFDINNEILNFGEFDIDLKKIIGSTNQYTEEETGSSEEDSEDLEEDDATGEGNGGGGGAGTGDGTGAGDVINNNDTGIMADINDLIDKVKMTSIIRVVEGLTYIDIDYVVYDPYNEYGAVYIEVVSKDKVEVVYLSKNDTHITLDNLNANTNYKLNFIYTVLRKNVDTGEDEYVPHTFETFDLKTKSPEYSISIYKISTVTNSLTYKVGLQEGFNVNKINVNMSFDYIGINPETNEEGVMTANIDGSIDITETSGKSVFGTFDIKDYNINPDTILRLTIKSVMQGEVEIPINTSFTFRFGSGR